MARLDIPIIDLTAYYEGEREGKRKVSAEINGACEDIGFFYVANHPILTDLRRRVFEEAASFFALADERKMQVSMERSLN
mgnify:CR=1 FL=1